MECLLLNALPCPDVYLRGKTRKEALESIQDAIRGYIESLREHEELGISQMQ